VALAPEDESAVPSDRAPKVLNRRTSGVPDGAVYVGRPTEWGNPYKMPQDGDREEVVRRYREWASCEPQRSRIRAELSGKDLVCWCAPKACHADVLLEIANAE